METIAQFKAQLSSSGGDSGMPRYEGRRVRPTDAIAQFKAQLASPFRRAVGRRVRDLADGVSGAEAPHSPKTATLRMRSATS